MATYFNIPQFGSGAPPGITAGRMQAIWTFLNAIAHGGNGSVVKADSAGAVPDFGIGTRTTQSFVGAQGDSALTGGSYFWTNPTGLDNSGSIIPSGEYSLVVTPLSPNVSFQRIVDRLGLREYMRTWTVGVFGPWWRVWNAVDTGGQPPAARKHIRALSGAQPPGACNKVAINGGDTVVAPTWGGTIYWRTDGAYFINGFANGTVASGATIGILSGSGGTAIYFERTE